MFQKEVEGALSSVTRITTPLEISAAAVLIDVLYRNGSAGRQSASCSDADTPVPCPNDLSQVPLLYMGVTY